MSQSSYIVWAILKYRLKKIGKKNALTIVVEIILHLPAKA